MGLSRSDARALRRRCEQVVAEIDIPEPFDLQALCEIVGRRRGRRLRVAHQQLGAGRGTPCGMWISLADEDIIVIEQNTSSLHQEQIGLHEIGHILCDHGRRQEAPGVPVDAAAPGRAEVHQLMPDLDPAMIRRVLGRSSYDLPQEREAEMVATLLGEAVRARATKGRVKGPTAQGGLAKLTEALGGGAP